MQSSSINFIYLIKIQSFFSLIINTQTVVEKKNTFDTIFKNVHIKH